MGSGASLQVEGSPELTAQLQEEYQQLVDEGAFTPDEIELHLTAKYSKLLKQYKKSHPKTQGKTINLKHEDTIDHIPKLNEDHFNNPDIPPFIDHRSKMPPVFDQGNIGSCTANALCAAFAFDDPGFIGSRLFLYYNERKMENNIDDDAGACLSDGVEALHVYGLCREEMWPYSDDDKKFKTTPPDHCYHEGVQHEASSYHHVDQTETAIKSALASGFPVVLGIKLYESFMGEEAGRTGKIPFPDADEECKGGHAVIMIGYDDEIRHWILRNSWGPDWGDGGHFYLPYEYVTDKSKGLCPGDLWVITKVSKAPTQEPPPKIKPSRAHVHHHPHIQRVPLGSDDVIA